MTEASGPVTESSEPKVAIGIDIGGSGIKAGLVDVRTGRLLAPRLRVVTPDPSTPERLIPAVARLVRQVEHAGPPELGAQVATCPVGIGMPSVVVDGITRSAAHINRAWIGFAAQLEYSRAVGRPVTLVNDADAAGLAEMHFGAGRGRMGVVIVLTLGTGVGSGLYLDGQLVPNTELGHLEVNGKDAERRSSAAARIRRKESWKEWARDLDAHLLVIDQLFSPRLIILGGGVSQQASRFIHFLATPVEIVPAALHNDAGIVGTALAAAGPPSLVGDESSPAPAEGSPAD